MAPRLLTLLALLLALSTVARSMAMNSTTMPKNSTTMPKNSTTMPINSTTCSAVSECVKRLDAGQTCELLPVPENAIAAPLRPVGYDLRILRPGIWSYHDGFYFTLFVYANRRLVVIDLPNSQGSNKPDGSGTRLTDAAEEILGKQRPLHIDLIYSHAHFDHIGGATRFVDYMKPRYPNANVNIYATVGTRNLVARSTRGRAPTPNKLIGRDGLKLWVRKGLVIHMDIVGGHTADDVLVYIPRSRKRQSSIIHFVDIVFPRWAPFPNVALTQDFGRYIAAHETILKYQFDVFSGGHLSHLGNRYDVRKSLRFARDLLKAATDSIANVTPEDMAAAGAAKVGTPGAREFGNLWYAFVEIQLRLQTDMCYRTMVEKWGCDLAGLDVVLRSHCFTVIQYVNIDQ